MTIPGAVAALNGLGLGPFRATLTGEELRRAGLLAMARVAEVLAPGAEHVIFGHTHRPGPLPGDEQAEWTTLSGTRLWNTGSLALRERVHHEPGREPLLARHGADARGRRARRGLRTCCAPANDSTEGRSRPSSTHWSRSGCPMC